MTLNSSPFPPHSLIPCHYGSFPPVPSFLLHSLHLSFIPLTFSLIPPLFNPLIPLHFISLFHCSLHPLSCSLHKWEVEEEDETTDISTTLKPFIPLTFTSLFSHFHSKPDNHIKRVVQDHSPPRISFCSLNPLPLPLPLFLFSHFHTPHLGKL